MKRFIKPENKYFKSFVKTIDECENNNGNSELNYRTRSFHKLISEIESKWENEEYYWLIEDDEFIGDMILRKNPTKEELIIGGHLSYFVSPIKRGKGYGQILLLKALEKFKEFKIDKILLTCYEDNTYSKRIIEDNGGKFIGRFNIPIINKVLLQYYILLSK